MKNENKCLSMLKGLSCIIVVLFHCPFPGIIGDGIIYALRFPVPIFFLISGYYCFHKEKYLSNAKHTLFFLMKAELFAFIVSYFSFLLGQEQHNPATILQQSNPLKVIFYGSLFNGTLWYLYAMFWSWVIFGGISKQKKGFHVSYCLAIPLLLIHIFGRIYITNHFDINDSVFLFRSFTLFAVPFLLIGRFIAEYESTILKKLGSWGAKLLFSFGLLLIVLEYLLWHQYMDFQISTFFVSIGLFLYALQNPNFSPSKILSHVGKYVSKYIYVFHMPIKVFLFAVLSLFAPDITTSFAFPLLVLAISIVSAYMYVTIKHKAIPAK